MLVLLKAPTRYGAWGSVVEVDDEVGAYLVAEQAADLVVDHVTPEPKAAKQAAAVEA